MKKVSKLIVYIIFLIAILVNLGIIYFSYKIPDKIIQTIITSLLISILTALIVNLITFSVQRNDYEEAYHELIEKNLPFLDKLNKKGLVAFDKTFPLTEEIYKNDFLNSNEVVLVMNDGKLFITVHITLFKQRFLEKHKTTRFIFMNPKKEDSISVLTRKNGHEGNYYVDKIKEFSKEINEYERDPTHTVEVLYQDFFTTMGILLTDSYAMISLYRISPGKDDVPNLVFKNNNEDECEFTKIKADVQRLIDAIKKEPNDVESDRGISW